MNDDLVSVRTLEIPDAEALVDCFDRCYDGTYPADAFHDPALLASHLAAGTLRSVVAVTADGEIVGHMGLRLRARDAITAEAGNTVVDPRYRGHHLSKRLGWALMELATALDLVGTHGYPTTAHPVIQKLEVESGGVETGVVLDYIPAETRYVGLESSGAPRRLAVTVIYRPLSKAPHRRIFIPARHLELARSVVMHTNLERVVDTSAAELPSAPSQLTARFERRRGLLRIEVGAPGDDLCRRVEQELARQPAELTLVDLPLTDAASGAATESLAPLGFFFAALLPEYGAAGDVLRLQHLSGLPSIPELATARARELFEYIMQDRMRAAAL